MWNVLIFESASAAGSLTVVVCDGGTAPDVAVPVTVAMVRVRIWDLKAGRVAANRREVVRRAAIVCGGGECGVVDKCGGFSLQSRSLIPDAWIGLINQ